MTTEFAKKGSVFLPKQFTNQENVNAQYASTGPEIWWQMLCQKLIPDAFVAGVGTGGTIMGVGRFLKEKNPDVQLHPLEPSNSPTLSTGHKIGKHRIQGISDEFIPAECAKLGIFELSSEGAILPECPQRGCNH